jgi:hypothetical protein
LKAVILTIPKPEYGAFTLRFNPHLRALILAKFGEAMHLPKKRQSQSLKSCLCSAGPAHMRPPPTREQYLAITKRGWGNQTMQYLLRSRVLPPDHPAADQPNEKCEAEKNPVMDHVMRIVPSEVQHPLGEGEKRESHSGACIKTKPSH